jgi:hypothetical protein
LILGMLPKTVIVPMNGHRISKQEQRKKGKERTMGFIIGLIIFGIPSAIIAGSKGFKPFRWLVAFGLIGLITVAVLESPNAQGLTDEERARRVARGDKIGAWMCGLCLALSAVTILIGIIIVSSS